MALVECKRCSNDFKTVYHADGKCPKKGEEVEIIIFPDLNTLKKIEHIQKGLKKAFNVHVFPSHFKETRTDKITKTDVESLLRLSQFVAMVAEKLGSRE